MTSEVKRVLLRLGGWKAEVHGTWLTQSTEALGFWAMLNHFRLSTEYCNIARMTCCDKSLALKSSVEVRRGMQGAVKDPWPEMIAMPATLTFYEEVCQSSQQPSCRLQIRKQHARQPATSNPSHEMRFWWGVSSII